MLTREVRPARSWFLEVASIWVAIGALAYTVIGCTTDAALVVTPQGPAVWPAQVEEAVSIWNDALGDECPPIVLVDSGMPVIFYAVAEWPGRENEVGFFDVASVNVRESQPDVERATLVHELGHALGFLVHSEDPASVMYRYVSGVRYVPTDTDARLVRALIGC